MTRDELARHVDYIINIGTVDNDDEAAHAREDELRLRVILDHCPTWVSQEILRLQRANFNRRCA